ncbi:energy-coupling factor transporter ATP-binding protein EcfA2 [Trueperella bonasi]|uniref:Energy-coupling factor transporter ATP-binding protein EcfA2 n=1 Tax=Trueperella bonasi TaxID=312286 RepID=A0ABT9NDF3_9ACTO|nr:dynamin family protein [Trueperella bonasi]MDP9805421.1 energy-coupling factor transporter ATP-binding protein EcfA2 [Trueperella bonasi]
MTEDFHIPQSRVSQVLRPFRDSAVKLEFPMPVGDAAEAALVRQDVLNQLDDYVIPRHESLEAPLLAVFGGSTGSGKSTLINSILGEVVALASAIRPTTRRPLLLFNPDDEHWFTDRRIFPTLARVTSHGPNDLESTGQAGNELEVRATQLVPPGIAFLDSPDIDSVVVENRQLAAQFLAAADLWVFVTTAARYSDAIPWAMLDDAAERNVVTAIILNRVPAGTGAEVRQDLDRMLRERGLEQAPLFMLSEQSLDEYGRVSQADVAPIRGWLEGLAADALLRSSVARQTLWGTVRTIAAHGEFLLNEYDHQIAGTESLRWDVNSAFECALNNVSHHLSDGTMLRGEVVQRWQDVVGTGEWARKLEKGVSALRDRVSAFFRTPVDTAPVEEAIEDSLHTLIVSEAQLANVTVQDAWNHGIARELVSGALEQQRSDQERNESAATLLRHWHNDLIAMIRAEGGEKRMTARALALSVNAIGTVLMIVIFASTGGLVGGEIAVAGGTAVIAQRVLEAIFGDDAVRRMAKQARQNLEQRLSEYFAVDKNVWLEMIDQLRISHELRDEYAQAFTHLADAVDADGRSL